MELITKSDSAESYYYDEGSIVEIRWKGIVDLQTCESTFMSSLKRLTNGGGLILNRSDLLEFEDPAKQWFKKVLLRKELVEVTPKLAFIAMVESTKEASHFSLALNKLFSVLYPDLKMMSFSTLDDAMSWGYSKHLKFLLENKPEETEIKKSTEDEASVDSKRNKFLRFFS